MAFQVVPVNKASSQIDSIEHDPDTKELLVRFHRGGSYLYTGIDANTAAGFTTADSLGQYLHNIVKPAASSYKKL